MGSKRWRTIWDAAPHCAGHGRWEPCFKVLLLQVSFYSEYNDWQDKSIYSWNFCSAKIDKRFFINLILFFLSLSGAAYGTFPPLVTRNEEPDEEGAKQQSVYDQVSSITHLTTFITTMNLPPRNRPKVLDEIGEFGLWQQRLSILFWLPCAVSGAIFLLGSFTSISLTPYIPAPRKIFSVWSLKF